MSIHVYIWLCIENEEEVSVEEEETAPPTETPPIRNSFYSDIYNRSRLPYNTRQAPVHLPFPFDFKLFIT
jgi:hypothetical protein